jgi:hypothetical protein
MRNRDRASLSALKKITPLPLPPSLEKAFEAVENLDAMHPSSRGQAFGAMIHSASHDRRARMTQDGR